MVDLHTQGSQKLINSFPSHPPWQCPERFWSICKLSESQCFLRAASHYGQRSEQSAVQQCFLEPLFFHGKLLLGNQLHFTVCHFTQNSRTVFFVTASCWITVSCAVLSAGQHRILELIVFCDCKLLLGSQLRFRVCFQNTDGSN